MTPALTWGGSFSHLSDRKNDRRKILASDMRDEKTIRERLEQMRGQFLQWGTPELQVFVTSKEEPRGWIRALEWILGKNRRK